MTLAETGELRTLTGNAVLDAGGAPIILDPTAGPPTIANDGMIVQAGSQVGAIGLFSLADATALKRTENSGVIPNKPATPILDFTQNGLVQGAFEGSNINAIEEMTKLIGVTRTFDGVSSEVSHTESSLQDAIKTLAG
jgi:flagellar basal-body rod protein FlgF